MLMAGNLFTELATALRRTMSPSRKGDTCEGGGASRGRPPEVDRLSKELPGGISDKVAERLKTGATPSSPTPEESKPKKTKLHAKRSVVSPAVPDIHPELTLEQVTSGARTGRPPVRQTSIEHSTALDMNTMFDYVPPGGPNKESLRYSRPRFREGRR